MQNEIMVIAGILDSELLDARLNDFFPPDAPRLNRVDPFAGGGKHFGAPVWMGCFQMIDHEAFAAYLVSLPWEDSRAVRLLVALEGADGPGPALWDHALPWTPELHAASERRYSGR